jgi:hypothetical protein
MNEARQPARADRAATTALIAGITAMEAAVTVGAQLVILSRPQRSNGLCPAAIAPSAFAAPGRALR